MQTEIIHTLIASSRPRTRALRGSMLILLGLSMFLGASLANPAFFASHVPMGWLLPQALLIAMITLVVRHGLRQRRVARLMQEAFEAGQLREWDRARQALYGLLRYPLTYRAARAESLLALAAVAESEPDYAASQLIYETLLQEGIAEPLQVLSTRIGLAGAMLRTGQVTDAVAIIDRLQKSQVPDSLRAQIDLLALFREVAMGQAEAAVERAEERRELFRQYLGTSAGYGYGLLAAAFERVGRTEQAARLWQDATLLVPSPDLLRRFQELEDVSRKYAAAEYAL